MVPEWRAGPSKATPPKPGAIEHEILSYSLWRLHLD